jgi:hypothetical protein
MIATKQTIEKIVGNKFFYVSYFKKDGSLREMQSARLNVKKHLKGGINRNPNIGKTQLIVFDNNISEYRTINLNKIYKIKCGDIELIDNLAQEILEELNQYEKERA